MKKWEVAVLIGFFAVFIILFFSVEQHRQPKVGDFVMNDNVSILVYSPVVKDSLSIGSKKYEAGAGWKFVILDINLVNMAKENRTFYAGRIEDEDGMVYFNYQHYYKGYTKLSPGKGRSIDVAYKMPTNAVPEKFHYTILNSDTWDGEILLKR